MIRMFLIFLFLCYADRDLNGQLANTNGSKSDSKSADSMNKRNSELKFLTFPLYNIHIGVGLINGVHLGFNLRFNESLSLEASFGKSLIFNSGTQTNFYNLGINVYTRNYSGLMFGLICGYKKNDLKSTGIISPNAGYFFIGEKGITIQLRGGLQFYTKKYDESSYGLEYLTFDCKIGYSF